MTEFIKHDGDKPRPELLPPAALMAISEVLATGARKYDDNNWMHTPGYSRYYGAALRHLLAWWGGEDLDPETGLHHLAHAGCCVLFMLELIERNRLDIDDRPKVHDE